MRLPTPKVIVFNAAAALVGVAALVAVARSVLISPTAAPCTERYHTMTAFSLERGGMTLTAADLQASLGGRDVGVMDNVTIGPLKSAPAPVAMAVALRKAPASSPSAAEPKSGTTFPWEPRVLQGKTSSCLSYHVLFPSDFNFQRGGALPGIAGTDGSEHGDRFLARLAWRPKGLGGATVFVTENGAARAIPAERDSFELPRGRWVKLVQEVVLNTPKKNDGTLRLWVDGTLAIERTDMNYRAKTVVAMSGISVDVFYGSGPDDPQATPSKNTEIWLSPLEVRWQ